MDSLEREEISDLHYSSVVSLSEQDAFRLKDRTLEFIKKSLELIRPSKAEVLYSLSVDFFSMKKD